MVRWEGVMWRRLTLTLLLASIASSSSSSSGSSSSNGGSGGGSNKNKSNRGNNGTACPESCRCTRIQPVENESDVSDIGDRRKSTEIHCKGKVPGIEFFPVDSRRLVLEDARPQEIASMLAELESRNSSDAEIGEERSEPSERHRSRHIDAPNLQDFVFINCSLRHLNFSLKSVSTSVPAKTLNLSCNEFEDTEALSLDEGDRLERLDLSENRLSELRSEAFARFSRLTTLNLRRNGIAKVEEDAFLGLASLESLDLSENRLATLDDGVFVPLGLLQKLDLSGNKLVDVLGGGHQWFGALGRLKELDVSRNGFATGVNINSSSGSAKSDHEKRRVKEAREKSPVTLETLPIGLKVLRLAENRLTEVELSLVLGSGRRLETVDASRIGLDRVPSALTRSVRALTLSGNRLTGIRSGDFDSYPLLRLVDLSHNLVNSVEEDAFGRLENLEILDLSNNRLTEIPQSLPGSLLHLLLSHNSIERLSAKDLQGVCKLKKLVISNNEITEIEVGSTSQLGLLAELDISDNPIKQIPANTFGGPRSLVRVRMSGLSSLEWDREKRADMAFPVPAPEGLVTLDLSRSPALAAQLLADEAALSACKSLRRLDLARTNLTSLRSDLAYLLPQLHILGLSDNPWNCSSANSEEILWLAEWISQHEEIPPPGKCVTGFHGDSASPSEDAIFLSQLTSRFLGRDGESASTETLTSSSSIFPSESQRLASTENQSSTTPLSGTTRRLVFDRDNKDDPGRSSASTPNSLTDNAPNIIDTTEASTFVNGGKDVFDVDDAAKLGNSSAANNDSLRFAEAKSNESTETSDASLGGSITTTASPTAGTESKNDYSTNASASVAVTSGVTVFDGNVELINDTVAEELIGREESAKTLSRTSEITSTATGAHPGMLVIVGAVLGAVVALSVVLSRRVTLTVESRMQSVVLLNRESYRRQENIEVHPMGQHHQQQQQPQPPPIITDLW